MCGLPGSGKTRLAAALKERLEAVRLSADEAMRANVEALQLTVAQRPLTLGTIIIVEWGTWTRTERDALRLGARAFGADVELHYLTAQVHVLLERIQRRRIEDPSITREDLQRWAQVIEVPTPEELALFNPPLLPDPLRRT